MWRRMKSCRVWINVRQSGPRVNGKSGRVEGNCVVICWLAKWANSPGGYSMILLWRLSEGWCEKEGALSTAISSARRIRSFFTFPLPPFTWSAPHIGRPTKVAPLYFWPSKCTSPLFYFYFGFQHISFVFRAFSIYPFTFSVDAFHFFFFPLLLSPSCFVSKNLTLNESMVL